MTHNSLLILSLTAFLIALPGEANDKTNTQIVVNSAGQLIEVPVDTSVVPELPIAVPESKLARIETARSSLEENGVVESPESTSLANRYREYARNLLIGGKSPNVFYAEQFDFAGYEAGMVDERLLKPESESYVIVEQSALARIYRDTHIGTIYLREMRNTEVGVLGGVARPNLEVAGYSGYVTKVRYRDGDVATLIMMPADEKRATFIEISGPGAVEVQWDGQRVELDGKIMDFLTNLFSQIE